MNRFPPLNALRSFEAAARHLNFRLAAEELHVTQGAVAQQVRRLEAELDVVLFHREPRGLSLTEAGRAYVQPVTRALEIIAEATAALRPAKTAASISVTPSLATKWLVPRLTALTRRHPDLDVKTVASEGLSNFQSDRIDIAVRQGTPPFGPGLRADLLRPLDLCAVCSPDLLNEDTPIAGVEDLVDYDLLHDAHGLWEVVLEGKLPSGSVRTMRFSQTSLAIDAAVAGQGIALAPGLLVEDDISAGRLRRVLRFETIPGPGFYIVAPRSPRNPETVEKMRTWLLEGAGRT